MGPFSGPQIYDDFQLRGIVSGPQLIAGSQFWEDTRLGTSTISGSRIFGR